MKPPRAISNSQLTAFKKSPAHWLHYVTIKKKQTDAMILGSACHCLALEKQNFDNEFFVLDTTQMPQPDKDFRTKVNAEWRDLQTTLAGDKIVLSLDQMEIAGKCVEALYNDKVAVKYLQEGKQFESDLSWKCLGLDFYGIRDITSDEFIADLKFVSDADPFVFQRYIFKTGIYRQGGMYLDGEMNGEYTGDPHKRVLFIGVETSEPYGVSVHELSEEVISFGVSEYRMLSSQLKDCIDNEYFPSYHHRSIEGTFDVHLPTYIATE